MVAQKFVDGLREIHHLADQVSIGLQQNTHQHKGSKFKVLVWKHQISMYLKHTFGSRLMFSLLLEACAYTLTHSFCLPGMLPKGFKNDHFLRPAVGLRQASITTIHDALKKSKQY